MGGSTHGHRERRCGNFSKRACRSALLRAVVFSKRACRSAKTEHPPRPAKTEHPPRPLLLAKININMIGLFKLQFDMPDHIKA
jgi:hypothetical protein